MDASLLIFLIAVLVVAILVFVAVALTKKRGPVFDKEEYQVAFLEIENTLDRNNALSYATVIVNADKLLDKALCEMGLPGKTMGDRLKRAGKEKFSQLNSVWHVHKLRNQIAHEHNFRVDYAQAKRALSVYKQALQDLGAI